MPAGKGLTGRTPGGKDRYITATGASRHEGETMKRLITLGIGAAIGYLLGSREGRQNLDKFAKNAQKFWKDPKTQEQVHKAADAVKHQAPVVADKATGLADKATDALKDRAPDLAAKANAAAHTAAEKGSSAAQHLADSASAAAEKSTGTTPTPGPTTASGPTTTATPTGDVLSDPSQSLETEGGGPARH
jgi:NADH dehydrogenase/NADH:ubiquinone oxidoreductase subunit G